MAKIYGILTRAEPGGWINLRCPVCGEDRWVLPVSARKPFGEVWEKIVVNCTGCKLKDRPFFRTYLYAVIVPAGADIRSQDLPLRIASDIS